MIQCDGMLSVCLVTFQSYFLSACADGQVACMYTCLCQGKSLKLTFWTQCKRQTKMDEAIVLAVLHHPLSFNGNRFYQSRNCSTKQEWVTGSFKTGVYGIHLLNKLCEV